MKTRAGYFQLHIFNENESEKHIYQNGTPREFELNNKVKNGVWERVRKENPYTVRWTASHTWGEPISLSSIGGLNIVEPVQPRRGFSQPIPVSLGDEWGVSHWEDESSLFVTDVNNTSGTITMSSDRPQGLTSGAAIRAMQDASVFGRAEVMVDRDTLRRQFPSNDQVRSAQEEVNRMMLERANNEMERRAAQSQADARRREEERTRQRRPWERARNFFGLD